MRVRLPRGKMLRLSSGQTITEYIILFPVLLILIMGAIQVALIYQAKFTLNYATFMGARQGALKNASLNSIKDGVAAGMTPLFMRWDGTGTPGLVDLSKARVIATIEVFNPLTTDVKIISPTKAAFDAIAGTGADAELPNDNLMYRSGSGDGMSVQDANLLKVRVTYCVKLVIPFVSRMIYSLVNGIEGVKNAANEFFWTPATVNATPTTPNMCTTASEAFASLSSAVTSLASSIPGMPSGVPSLLGSAFSGPFPTIPLLNWKISGLRIPVTSEAIVRMQSPITKANRDSLN